MPAISSSAIGAMLNALAVDTASLHTDFPGLTGANEVSGGAPAYARMPAAFGVAAGGIRSLSGAVTFDVPATTVRWIGFWAASTFLYYTPNGGGTPKEFIADPAVDLVRCVAHGYANDDLIVFYGGVVPGGLVEGTPYYVISSATDSFQVAATVGGAAIDLTSAGGTDVQVCSIVADVYASQGTHQLATAQFGLPL